MLPRPNKRWEIKEKITDEVERELLDYPAFFRQILFARGIRTALAAQEYLEGRVELENHNPFNLLDMEDTVKRLLWAVDHHEPVVVYGDYDVDGVTATALMVQVLRAYGAVVSPHIPNRFDDGYGLNIEAIEKMKGEGVQVIITVDCGIRSPLEAARAEELGIDLIISDHHQPGEVIPRAYTVICPKRSDDLYPDKDLSGVGVAYKIAQALAARRPQAGVCTEDWLDLVALGTVADVVPLRGENRHLVHLGLQQMRLRMLKTRPGLYSLANVAGLKIPRITAGDIAFILGPRLNAAGRLKTALDSLNLLFAESIDQAGLLSQDLDNQNRERQEISRKTQEEAIRQAQTAELDYILFAFHESFNPGIVGLAAARLVDTYYRPAIVGEQGPEFTRASCRSIPEFHITRALDQCGDLFERHGGHALAAGFTIRNERIPALITRLREIAAKELSDLDLRPTLRADLEIPLDQLHPRMLTDLDRLQPTGQANPEAVFVSRDLRVVKYRTVGAEGQHLKMTLSDGRITYDAIAFRQGKCAGAMPPRVDVMYVFEQNEFNGRVNLQLNVRDFKAAGIPD